MVYILVFIKAPGGRDGQLQLSAWCNLESLGKSLSEELSTLDWPGDTPVGDLSTLLIDIGRPSPAWVAPSPKMGILHYIRREKVS